jgi:hypothetical protein
MPFGHEATWRDGPGPLVASGATLIDTVDELAERLRPWL